MFHRSSLVSVDANAGMAVPVTPTDILRNIIAGVTSAIAAALPIAGGLGVMPRAAGPSPIPVAPWHEAQVLENSCSPAATLNGFVGSWSAASLPSAAVKRRFRGTSTAGGRLAATAAMIVSRMARAAGARSPGSRSAASRASFRKPTAS